MHYRKFIIDKYRAIEHAEVGVGNQLIPLIGINESGKTSILKAILCFDKNSDKYGGGEHLDYKNNYQIGDHDCFVTAEVVIDSISDIERIAESLQLQFNDSLIDLLKSMFEKKSPILIQRDIKNRRSSYSIANLELAKTKNTQLAKAIYHSLPMILYFDDFADRVPESLSFSYIEADPRYRIKNTRLVEWQRILEEVFQRATNGNNSLYSFISIEDSDDRDGLLNDINDKLNDEIVSDWKRLKSSIDGASNDSEDLALELRYTPSESGFVFEFKVTDRSRKNKRVFDVIERSKGFQWFFNFLMKLKFNPKYQKEASGAIYLLDEPGSYLHASAQEKLLKELADISNTNTILYCTHSHHLLDPDTINIGQTRIVEKDGGYIGVVPYGSAEVDKSQGALSPLFQALQIRTGIFNRTVTNALITEGIIDFYWFSLLKEYLDGWDFPGVDIIPGAGANGLKELISWSIAWTDRYAVFLDSDQEGKLAFTRYTTFFGEVEANNFYNYSMPNNLSNIKLEKFISDGDQQRLSHMTGAVSIKRAIIQLFYSKENVKKDFFDELDETTINNMSLVKDFLNTHFGLE
jgi:energy-coupling factor transporter ATP-binding protein EcfA2